MTDKIKQATFKVPNDRVPKSTEEMDYLLLKLWKIFIEDEGADNENQDFQRK